MIAYPSLIEPPSTFKVLSNEVLSGPYCLIFRMQLACACGKHPYLCIAVNDIAALTNVAFWQDLWRHMYDHEKAECQQEGREFARDLEWEQHEKTQG